MCGRMFLLMCVIVVFGLGSGLKATDIVISGSGVTEDIYQMAANKSSIKVITSEYTPEELKGLIGQSDLLISARTHPVIGAASMYVPSVAISCPPHQRGHAIIGEMLGQQKWVCDVEKIDFDTLISIVTDAWSARDKIRKDLEPKVEIVKKRAFRNAELVKELLALHRFQER